ncbi:MAG: hypothetical protein JWQ62_1474 [Lacunisphaera sp.]|nr:hypothetical protein [Lacunisphaera sp.]
MNSAPPIPSSLRFLHLEDNLTDASLVHAQLTGEWPGCAIKRVDNRADFLAALERESFDLILSDFSMVDFTGMEALILLRQQDSAIPFLFLSGTIGEENAVEALKRGATDYVVKDRMGRLIPAIRQALVNVREHALRRQAEIQLGNQARWLDEARDAICVTDLSGRLTYLNHSATLLHGRSSAEARDRSLAELFGLFSQALLPVALEQVHRTGTWTGEIQVVTPDGALRQLESRWTLVRDPAGRPHSVLLINTDVTERRQLETDLRRSQRIESLGMLAGGIAHDLNNMLSPITMGLGLLRTKTADPELLRLVNVMAGSAEKGATLIRQVLAFARGAEGEKLALQVRPVIRDVVDFLAETLPRSIEIKEEAPPGLWLIHGDATQLHQVLMNLGVNARDAMPTGGLLSFQAENTTVDAATAAAHPGAQSGPHVVMTVEDTGTGIPPELVDRIFDPFFTTKALGKGTGLGLSMALGIVKAHGGFLTVHSEPGHGTAFRLFFPAAQESLAPATPAPAPAAPRGHGETILVIDDEEMVREMVRAFLEHYGYRVRLAADGASGVELFRQHQAEIQVVMTDMMMPGLQIGDLLPALRAIDSTVKVVLMSGLIGPENRDKIAALGCAGFLQKPMTGEELVQAVQQALSKKSG